MVARALRADILDRAAAALLSTLAEAALARAAALVPAPRGLQDLAFGRAVEDAAATGAVTDTRGEGGTPEWLSRRTATAAARGFGGAVAGAESLRVAVTVLPSSLTVVTLCVLAALVTAPSTAAWCFTASAAAHAAAAAPSCAPVGAAAYLAPASTSRLARQSVADTGVPSDLTAPMREVHEPCDLIQTSLPPRQSCETSPSQAAAMAHQ